MALVLIIGALFCDQATADDNKKTVARYWLATRMPEFRRNKEMICSGERSILTDFEVLAPEPEREPALV